MVKLSFVVRVMMVWYLRCENDEAIIAELFVPFILSPAWVGGSSNENFK